MRTHIIPLFLVFIIYLHINSRVNYHNNGKLALKTGKVEHSIKFIITFFTPHFEDY